MQQPALRDFHQGMRNWWGGSHRRPTWRRRFVHESFCVRDVVVRKLSRKWAMALVPKLGPVRFRLSRPMPDNHGMGRVTLDRQEGQAVFRCVACVHVDHADVNAAPTLVGPANREPRTGCAIPRSRSGIPSVRSGRMSTAVRI